MRKRLVGYILLANLICSIFIPSILSTDESHWWNDGWSFRQEITIPINTSSTAARYQPIDIPIEFEHLCWAKNEQEHSVRVAFQRRGMIRELESQIYDLKYADNDHISACSLVFLIPDEANGKETYYVYYDDEKTSGPTYDDRVIVDESYYQYEPIQGLPFESRYYKITEGDAIVYAIAQEGTFMDSAVSQQVTKLKPNMDTVIPKNGEQLASFDFTYWYLKDEEWFKSTTSEQLISKEIFVDGNLMIKCGIVSQSADGLFQTTVIYKYYYCPTEQKRIYTHVKNEVIDYPVPLGEEIDVYYIIFRCGGIKSSIIEDLNFGNIPPQLHVYHKEERVLTYDLDQYPENYLDTVIAKTDDCDLGSHAWISVGEGDSGKAHAIILGSNSVLKSGTGEKDGIEIQVYESKVVQLPGLEGRFANICLGRNAYEIDDPKDEHIPKDMVIEFDAEFFSTTTGGYHAVDEEARLYQALIKYQPTPDNNVTDGEEPDGDSTLITYIHLPWSLSAKLRRATVMGKKPYLSAELYHENHIRSSGGVSRLALTEDMNIDWRNVSLFRKIRFAHLVPGTYLVKIWLENPLVGNQRECIGLQILDIQGDTESHILCRPEGKLRVSVLDQHGIGLEHAKIYLMNSEIVVAESQTDANGDALIGAPCGLRETYTFTVVYDGFLVYDEDIRLGYIRRILPLRRTVTLDVYDVTIHLQDDQGDTPTFDIEMTLTSDDMDYATSIHVDKISNGAYTFTDLYPATYTLDLRYQSFEIEECIDVPKTSSMAIILHDLTVHVTDDWGLTPEVTLDIVMKSDELKKPVVIPAKQLSAGTYLFEHLYPANYTLKLAYKSCIVEEPVCIPGTNDGGTAVVFPATFNVTTIVVDARGNPFPDATVIMSRGTWELHGITDKNGNTMFSLPPGTYVNNIYINGSKIAERKVDVTNEKSVTIVTVAEPLLPPIIIGLTVLMMIGAAVFGYRKKDISFVLKMGAVGLAIIAVVSPWWSIVGSTADPHFETTTNLFLMPTELVTITSNSDVVAGELAILDETFTSAMNLLPLLIGFGCICILLTTLLQRMAKKRLSIILFFASIVLFVGSLLIFLYGMTQMAEIGVGSFIGHGDLMISIPGEELYETLSCGWGPSIGFYVFVCTIGILITIACLKIRRIKVIQLLKRFF